MHLLGMNGGGGGLAMCLELAVTRSRPVIMTEL